MKWAGAVKFCLFPLEGLVARQHCTYARAMMEGKWPHTHTQTSAVLISTALRWQLCHFLRKWDVTNPVPQLSVYWAALLFSYSVSTTEYYFIVDETFWWSLSRYLIWYVFCMTCDSNMQHTWKSQSFFIVIPHSKLKIARISSYFSIFPLIFS